MRITLEFPFGESCFVELDRIRYEVARSTSRVSAEMPDMHYVLALGSLKDNPERGVPIRCQLSRFMDLRDFLNAMDIGFDVTPPEEFHRDLAERLAKAMIAAGYAKEVSQ